MSDKQPYVKPVADGVMEHLFNESIMLFGWQKYNGKKYRLFYGIGVVCRVVKGDKQDLVHIRFGCFNDARIRLVVVYRNHARRQLLTLKRGQVCQVFGFARYHTTDIMLNGVKTKGTKIALYAHGISGWYVPTMLDIKKLPRNDDICMPTDSEKKLQETFDSVLNEFMSGKGEDNG